MSKRRQHLSLHVASFLFILDMIIPFCRYCYFSMIGRPQTDSMWYIYDLLFKFASVHLLKNEKCLRGKMTLRWQHYNSLSLSLSCSYRLQGERYLTFLFVHKHYPTHIKYLATKSIKQTLFSHTANINVYTFTCT